MPSTNATTTSSALPSVSQLGADLLRVSGFQRARSLAQPFVCFVAYLVLAYLGHWPAAVLATVVMSFITYGSTSHDLVHRNLGLSRRTNDILLALIECLALRSGHAYQLAHLHHHKRFPHEDDVEGAAAHMSLPRALLEGVVFPVRIYRWALKRAGRTRTWIVCEGAACVAVVAAAVVLVPVTPVAAVYVALMLLGSWSIPLMTSYIPHDANGRHVLAQTRVFRGRVASAIAFEHLYHLEHHLYPRVPHHHWPALAKRLDPYLDAAGVRRTVIWF